MLDDFCFSPEAKNLDALRAQAFLCHLEGRHLGGICAKLYIANDAHPAQPGNPDATRHPDGDQTFRAAIMSRIARQGDPSEGGRVDGGDTETGSGPTI